MDKEIKERIAAINSGIIPEGYKKTKVGIVPVEWEIVKLANIMHNEPRPVDKPNEPYIRIGIRSHAKGTFQELVENPAEVNMDTLYVVKKDDIVVNITFAWEHAIALASEEDDGKLVSHRFPTYVFDNNSPLYYKYVFCQDMFRQRLELISPGGAGRNRVLNKTDFINLEIYHPPLPEQQKIAEILSTQDKLIELQEKKIEQLKELKKAYLQKMFPKKGSKYPELRFKGFTDAWEQRKVGELTVESSEYTTLEAGFPLLTSSRNGLMYQNEYRGKQTTDSTETMFSIVPLGACTYRHMSDDDVFHLNVNRLEKGLVSREYPVFYASDDNNLDFIVQQINSSAEFRSFCAEQKKGGTRTRLYYKNLCEFQMLIPNTEEQEKIATFLLTLDTLITLHQRECFSFDFSGESAKTAQKTISWEQRKFSELTEIRSASRVHKDEWQSSGVPFYRSSDVMAALNGTENEKAFISEELYEKLSAVSGKLEKGDVLVTGGGSVGKPYIVPNNEPLYTKDADLLWIKNNENLDPYFVYTFFFSPTFTDYLNSVSHVGTIAHYTITQLGETPITLPCVSEQQKIGDYFRNLDFLITLHQRKLETLQKMKKSLLQKMFV